MSSLVSSGTLHFVLLVNHKTQPNAVMFELYRSREYIMCRDGISIDFIRLRKADPDSETRVILVVLSGRVQSSIEDYNGAYRQVFVSDVIISSGTEQVHVGRCSSKR